MNHWAPPVVDQPVAHPPAKRRPWKLWAILGGGILVIGAIGAIASPEEDTDAAPATTSAHVPETTADTTPPTTAEAVTTDQPTTTAVATTTAAPELPPTTAATVIPVVPVLPVVPATTPPIVPVVPETTVPPVVATYVVSHVVDGDTVDVRDGVGREQRVRLIGIDTPEMDTCGGQPASDALAALVAGQPVTLTMGGDGEDTDRYGRLLRYVDLAGTDAGLTLIKQGLAIARYDSRDGYGRHDREDAYVAADAASPNYVCPAAPAPVAEIPPAAPPAAQTPPPAAVYYENCTAVKAAGAAPIHPGDPGWQDKFDRDHDGIGCES